MIWNASPRFFANAWQRGDRFGWRAGRHRARGRRGAEQRPGLAAMNPLQHLEADLLIGRQQIGRLSADQAVGADGVREQRGQRDASAGS